MKPNIKAIRYSPPCVREVCSFLIKRSNKLKANTLKLTYKEVADALSWKVGARPMRYTVDQLRRAFYSLEKNFAIEINEKSPSLNLFLSSSLGYGDEKSPKQGRESHKEVIDYLNKVTGSHFSYTDTHLKYVRGRMNEGHSVEDFKKVINVKYKEWGTDPKYSMYLRPSTLFLPSKFEGYLNQKIIHKPSIPKKLRVT